MAAWKCLGCGFRTGSLDLVGKHRCGNAGLWEHCRCGSGGHPRRCDVHPDAYERHIKEINDAQAEEAAGEGDQ